MTHVYAALVTIVLVAFFRFSNEPVAPSQTVHRGGELPIDTIQQFFKRIYATDAVAATTVESVADTRVEHGKGVVLKPGVAAALDGERTSPDLVFKVNIPASGRYVMRTYAVTDAEGAALMKAALSKFESLYIRIQIGNQRPTKRVVYVPWDKPNQKSGTFQLDADDPYIRIWLPRGVRLGHIELATHVPPAVPERAEQYRPVVVPPASRPRLWVNAESLPIVRMRLLQGENKAVWDEVRETALKPYHFEVDPDKEVAYHHELEMVAEKKAFYYLMTGDKKIGLETVKLMSDYLSHVEFGNMLDITREIGRAIHIGSEVYDWCYDLLTPADRQLLYRHLMRLADDMEIGWPPFLQRIVTGHGAEGQVNRDLLSMSIAVYDEDPLPFRYCSYWILEHLVPMRDFEYQSPRHNQGVNYGSVRYLWDLHAAWLFYRMTGKPVFDDRIKEVDKYWLYMRIPDGQMLRDGDGFLARQPGKFYYWQGPLMTFMSYTYTGNPIVKADFERQGRKLDSQPLFLLLNDPGVKAEPSRTSLPLTMDFGKILGSMVARTGWEFSMESNDVVAEIKGGGYLFGNHQHSDAGSIQLYYRGFQFGDLGVYRFYGTPYDFNFQKRSISHSMLLVVDPEEKFLDTESNDGGTRFNQTAPLTPAEVLSNPWFRNGEVVSSSFGPSDLKPSFSYFSVDLASAYSSKITDYTRSFCFLNMDRDDIPAVIILSDDITAADADFKKYWQVNAHNQPMLTDNGFVLHNSREGLIGRTHVNMLIPAKTDRRIQVYSGAEANSSFGRSYPAPTFAVQHPELMGHRIMVSPESSQSRDRFLTVFQVVDGDTKPLPVRHAQTEVGDVICIGDRVVNLSNSKDLIGKSFTLDIPSGTDYQVALTGMQPGSWKVTDKLGKQVVLTEVIPGKNTLFFVAGGGSYNVKRVR